MKIYHGTARRIEGKFRAGAEGVIFAATDWDTAEAYARSDAERVEWDDDTPEPAVYTLRIDDGMEIIDIEMPEADDDFGPPSIEPVINDHPDADVIILRGVSQGGSAGEDQVVIRRAEIIEVIEREELDW